LRDVDKIVEQIDKRKKSESWRDPDRPATVFVPLRQRQDPPRRWLISSPEDSIATRP
jgi:hypothetical protein